VEEIEQRIFLIRGRKVMLSPDLASLYRVEVRALMQAVRRNSERLPDDFAFQLTSEEMDSLRSQSVILKKGRGQHSKYNPFAFTQEGIAMLSGVLTSKCAVQVNILIMRTFVKLRELISSHKELIRRLDGLERKYDSQFKVVFNSIKELIEAQPKNLISTSNKKRSIGFDR